MLRALFLWLSLSMSLLLPAQALIEAPLRIMSFNIRYHNPADGYHAWPNRRDLVADVIRLHEVDVLGLQEVLPGQVTDILNLLPEYALYGVARDTGRQSEFVPICYRRSRLQLLDGGTFWLSETPDKMSKGWDAALNRIVTWVKFEDRQTHKQWLMFNTHLDHRGIKARTESTHLLLKQIQRYNPQGLPVVLSGDFNAQPGDSPYQLITQDDTGNGLRDARLEALSVIGPEGTWTGFTIPRQVGGRIDYLFCQGSMSVLRYSTLTDGWNHQIPSDHLPVMVEVVVDPVQVLPQAHAHNDYEHAYPLAEALYRGFNRVEVDIWLDEGKLFVAHESPRGGTGGFRYLEGLYLEPLARRVQAYRGRVYPHYPEPFVLMLDLKSEGTTLYRHLRAALAPYRWMTEGSEPALRILLSGKRPMEAILADQDRFMEIDGRPEHLQQEIDPQVMPLISMPYQPFIDWDGRGPMPLETFQRLRQLAQRVHDEGKLLRLWGSPERESVWQALLDAGVDVINTDELGRLQRFFHQYEPAIDLERGN